MHPKPKTPVNGYILRHHKAPGDVVVFTALLRDLAFAHPRLKLDARVHWQELLQHNPHLTSLSAARSDIKFLHLQYKEGIKVANNGGPKIHFLREFYNNFTAQTGLSVPLRLPKPDLHLHADEKDRLVSGRYWVVMAGGKTDVPLKVWRHAYYQQVADELQRMGLGVVQCGAVGPLHRHDPLNNALNLVGRTNLREFMRIIRDAEGVISPVTAAMHIAAAFDKPCVVVAGGREAPWWEAYDPQYGGFGDAGKLIKVPHRYLHTLGQLDCCKDRGCWKNKLFAEKPNDLVCRHVVTLGSTRLPQCLLNITPDQVLAAVRSYYDDGTLPRVVPTDLINVNRIPATLKAMPMRDVHETANPAMVQTVPPPATESAPTGLQHPLMGGKITIFALCYGDYLQLHRRCLDSILQTVPTEQLDLRVATNAVGEATLNYLATLPITKTYIHYENQKKYPVMREMFHDPQHPITTRYLCWFDDDSYVVSSQWLARLSEAIVNNHNQGARLYGIKFTHSLQTKQQADWFKQAPWFRHKNWQLSNGAAVSNGNHVPFVSGGFWALASECVKSCQIPDVRLNHNGGDITIGAQVYQAGYKIKDFNRGKVFVFSSGAPRRGYEETFPWRTNT